MLNRKVSDARYDAGPEGIQRVAGKEGLTGNYSGTIAVLTRAKYRGLLSPEKD